MENPLVSAIIPFYNNVTWLIEAIESVLNQTYHNIELILVDDGSREDLSDFLNKYGEKLTYIKKENGGPASARNLGIRYANGEYVAFLDSDDIWLNDKIQKQVDYMKQNECIWSHTNYFRFGENINDSIMDVSWFRNNVFRIVISSCPIATPCVMIRTQVLNNDADLRFAEDMKAGEDTYFWLRLSLKYEVGCIDEPLSKVRIRGQNAALSAYAQLSAKAQLYSHIKYEKLFRTKRYFDNLTRFLLFWCMYSYLILNKIIVKNFGFKEFLAKVLYLLPWILFKLKKALYIISLK